MSLMLLLRHSRRQPPAVPLEPLPDDAFARMSALNAATPWVVVLPPPDGTIATRDRLMLLNQYVRP